MIIADKNYIKDSIKEKVTNLMVDMNARIGKGAVNREIWRMRSEYEKWVWEQIGGVLQEARYHRSKYMHQATSQQHVHLDIPTTPQS